MCVCDKCNSVSILQYKKHPYTSKYNYYTYIITYTYNTTQDEQKQKKRKGIKWFTFDILIQIYLTKIVK